MTKIRITEDAAKDLIHEICEDGKMLSKKYLKKKGVKDVETEVQNNTLIKVLSKEK